MQHFTDYIIEKLKVGEFKTSFSQRHRDKHVLSRAKINKFRKFFEDLIDMAGLRIGILSKEDDDSFFKTEICLYKIRENEPDKILTKDESNKYVCKSYKGLLSLLFDEDNWDWNDEENLEGWKKEYFLCLYDLDDDEINSLEKLGFEEKNLEVYKAAYTSKKSDYMIISIKDLCNNIDKIYKAFFE